MIFLGISYQPVLYKLLTLNIASYVNELSVTRMKREFYVEKILKKKTMLKNYNSKIYFCKNKSDLFILMFIFHFFFSFLFIGIRINNVGDSTYIEVVLLQLCEFYHCSLYCRYPLCHCARM